MITVRPALASDFPAIAVIQAASPEAACWDPAGDPDYNVSVAMEDGAVRGFLVARTVAEGEHEILNLAVAPQFRRRGIATSLVVLFLKKHPGAVFLEARESNRSARSFYQAFGFKEVARRSRYYETPPEAAIVMKFHSC